MFSSMALVRLQSLFMSQSLNLRLVVGVCQLTVSTRLSKSDRHGMYTDGESGHSTRT